MIRYSLKCDQGHTFESWFQSAQAYDSLAKSGHVECPVCGSATVTKALMSPQLTTKENAKVTVAEPAAPTAPPEIPAEVQKAMDTLRREVEQNSDYVGRSFAKEAREMHDGEIPERAIHGEANLEEARALIQDGVPILPLPFRDRRGTN